MIRHVLVVLFAVAVVVVSGAANQLDAIAARPCGREPIEFARNPAWSPDGARIAFECSGLCVMNADGTNKTTLLDSTSESVEREPAWSPDGRRIAFIRQVQGLGFLFLMNADGTQPKMLSTGAGQPSSPAWSPDGRKIAFTDDEGSGTAVYVISVEGGHPVQVAAGAASLARPAWSPDGSRIAFPDREGRLAVIGVDGGNRTRLTDISADDPAWSADGKIAFTSARNGRLALFVIAGAGATPSLVTMDGDNSEAAWSPDGRRIAFTSERDGTPTTFVMNADGSNQTRLFASTVALSGLEWSPDGQRLAFAAIGRYGLNGIYVIGADGAGQVRLTSGADDRDSDPAWSHDGEKLAFIRVHNKGASRLNLMSRDGSRMSQLAADGESTAWLPDGRVAFKAFGAGRRPILAIRDDGTRETTLIARFDAFGYPVFSPDGQALAFTKFDGDGYTVHLMRSDGSGETALAPKTANSPPAWSPNGRKIAFVHPESETRCSGIDVMNADGSQATALSAESDSGPAWSPDGKRIGFVSRRDGEDAIYIMTADGGGPTRITKQFK